MDAQKLSSDQQKQSIRGAKAKKQKIRATLFSPYSKIWPKLDQDKMNDILQAIQSTLEPMNLGKLKVVSYPTEMTLKEKVQFKKTARADHWKQTEKLRSEIRLGINAVTRAAEKDALAAVLVCLNTCPIKMTEHFVSLCSSNNIHGLAIDKLGSTLGPLLNLKSCRAIGFGKSILDSQSAFHGIYESIVRANVHQPTVTTSKEAKISQDETVTTETSVAGTSQTTTTDNKNIERWYILKGQYPKCYKFKPGSQVEDFISLGATDQPSFEPPAKKQVVASTYLSMNLNHVGPRADKKKKFKRFKGSKKR